MRVVKQLNQTLVYWQVLKRRQSSPWRRWQLLMRPADRARCHAVKFSPLIVSNWVDPKRGNTVQCVKCQVLPAGTPLTSINMAQTCSKKQRSFAPGQSWASRLLQRQEQHPLQIHQRLLQSSLQSSALRRPHWKQELLELQTLACRALQSHLAQRSIHHQQYAVVVMDKAAIHSMGMRNCMAAAQKRPIRE